MAVDESLKEIAFPAVHYLLEDGLPLGFLYKPIDSYRDIVPPWRWPIANELRRGGIFDSQGVLHDCDGAVGYRLPIPVLTPVANSFALGGALFVSLHGDGSYGPKIVGRKKLPMDEFRLKLKDVIFEHDDMIGEFKAYVAITDRKLEASRSFEQMVEVVRWHILTDGGKVEFAPNNKFYGRTPTV